ncbi:MAG: carbohydrate binding domain-containing protein, partial [Candidatus Andersenbacteria bacterium]
VLDGGITLGTETDGDYVASFTAGNGLTGSASGEGSTPTLAVVSGNGAIVVNANDIALTLTTTADALSATTSSSSGLEILSSGLTLLQGCGTGQVLQWNEASDIWACADGVTTANAFVQNGNDFGGNAVLGTNGSGQTLGFETENVTKWILEADGDFVPQSNDDYDIGSDALRIQDIYTGPGTVHIGTSTTDEGTLSYDTTTNSFIFGNPTASQNAFQFQNASSANIFNVNTSTTAQLIQNNSIESSTNGWVAKGSSTISISDAVTAQYGSRFLSTTTTAVADDGAAYQVPLKASTQYSLSLWLRRSTSTTSDINIGYQENGSDINCLTGQTVNTTWTQFTCTFTTGATVNDTTNIYFKQTGTTAQTIYLDGASLVQAAASLTFDAGGNNLNIQSLTSGLTFNNTNTGEIQPWQLNANALPDTRRYPASAVANGYIYLVGGCPAASCTAGSNTVYYAKLNADGSTGAWATNGNNLPNNTSQHTVATANGYLYVIAGADGGQLWRQIYYAKLNADGSTGSWTTNANTLSTSVTRRGHGSVVANGYMYIIGGVWCGGGINDACDNVYYAKLNADGSTGPWALESDVLPAVRTNYQVAAGNGYV